jgi:hypothetical protein
MGLPSYLSAVMEGIGRIRGRQSIAEITAGRATTNSGHATRLMGLASHTDKMVLSYIWLAIESGYNVLVLAEKDAESAGFIRAISNFIPPYKTAIYVQGNGILDSRLNFLNIVGPKRADQKILRGIVQGQNPDALIMENSERDCINWLLSQSKYGTQFIAPLDGNFLNRQLVRALLSKQFRVGRQDINMLDIAVILEKAGSTTRIASMTEYKWIDRWEVDMEKGSIIPKRYENMRMLNGNMLDMKSIRNSKIVKKHARLNLISEEAAIGELTDRAMFLERLAPRGDGKMMQNPTDMYYEIK